MLGESLSDWKSGIPVNLVCLVQKRVLWPPYSRRFLDPPSFHFRLGSEILSWDASLRALREVDIPGLAPLNAVSVRPGAGGGHHPSKPGASLNQEMELRP